MAAIPSSVAGADHHSNDTGSNHLPALAVLTSLFFLWGFLTCLNDILIPHLKAMLVLSYAKVMLVQLCFFAAYFIMSAPSGWLVEQIGYKRGIIIGLLTAALGCVIFFPAAGTRSFTIFLLALFVLASGITLLQVAANPFVAILGKPETASSRLNLTQAFNSLGTTIAPIFGSVLILAATAKIPVQSSAMDSVQMSAYRVAEARSVQIPYLGLASALLLVAVIFACFKLPCIEAAEGDPGAEGERQSLGESAWNHRHLVLGAIAIFVYVGGEVAIGSFLVNYISQPHIGAMPVAEAARYVSFYWGGAMVGRFAGAYITRIVKPAKVLTVHALVVVALILTTIFTHGRLSMWCILAVGLFNSIMFPTIFTLAIDGLGRHTGQASGILCMAIVGGAIIPTLQGLLADRIGIQTAFFLPVCCYAYIAYYGFRGYRRTFGKVVS